MAQRVHNGVRLGTVRDAAAECVTARSPKGVSPDTYRYYRGRLGAPGPYVDPGTGLQLRDGETREVMFDLDAVATWNSERVRPGSYLSDVEYRTPVRHDLLSSIGAGRVEVRVSVAPTLRVDLFREGEPLVGRVIKRPFNDMHRAGLLALPEASGPVTLTEAGRALLARWDEEAAALVAGKG